MDVIVRMSAIAFVNVKNAIRGKLTRVLAGAIVAVMHKFIGYIYYE